VEHNEQKLKQIEELLSLVEERDQIHLDYNKQIAEHLAPTMLLAIVELLGLPTDQLHWVSVDIIDSAISLVVRISYDPTKNESEFLKATATGRADDAAYVERNIRFNVPIEVAFQPANDVKQYITELLGDKLKKPEPKKEAEPIKVSFDPGALTTDQIRQMLFFQQTTLETKQ